MCTHMVEVPLGKIVQLVLFTTIHNPGKILVVSFHYALLQVIIQFVILVGCNIGWVNGIRSFWNDDTYGVGLHDMRQVKIIMHQNLCTAT